MEQKRAIMRSVRIPLELDNQLLAIAKFEDRTVSKIINRFLSEKASEYFAKSPEFSQLAQEKEENEILRAMRKAQITPEDLMNKYGVGK